MKSILDPSFKYTSSVNTDLAKTFARVRREQRKGEEDAKSRPEVDWDKVRPIKQRTA